MQTLRACIMYSFCLMAIAVACLWVRSYFTGDMITIERGHLHPDDHFESYARIVSVKGIVVVHWESRPQDTSRAGGVRHGQFPAKDQVIGDSGLGNRLGVHVEWWPMSRYPAPYANAGWRVSAPYWFLFAICSLWPFFTCMRVVTLRRQGRARTGRCKQCGYDLTGNVSGICPECGAPLRTGKGKGDTASSSRRRV